MATIVLRSVKGSPLTNNEVDTNFSNINGDKYESGDSMVADDLEWEGEQTSSIAAAVAAAGATQGAATAATTVTSNVITSGTVGQGVLLPISSAGLKRKFTNATSVSLKIYPATSGTINGAAANAAIDIPAGATFDFLGTSATAWITTPDIVVYDESGTRLN